MTTTRSSRDIAIMVRRRASAERLANAPVNHVAKTLDISIDQAREIVREAAAMLDRMDREGMRDDLRWADIRIPRKT